MKINVQLASAIAALSAIPAERLHVARCYCGGYHCPGDCSPDDLLAPAEYAWSWEYGGTFVHFPRRGGCVAISEEEFTELRIPERSRRGPDDPYMEFVLVDRRCLKRYRRKAGRR